MKKLIVLTGAGISADSGLQTFRDAGGLWEGYNVYDVANLKHGAGIRVWYRVSIMNCVRM